MVVLYAYLALNLPIALALAIAWCLYCNKVKRPGHILSVVFFFFPGFIMIFNILAVMAMIDEIKRR